ncbi:histidine kinase [Amycolatopsis minnesotensis]|uniref:histidine kinase n=2 Tax=Amycolatopsis minnesotensis TaxID=337894 RepID=A0ABN2S0H6_9PSEU
MAERKRLTDEPVLPLALAATFLVVTVVQYFSADLVVPWLAIALLVVASPLAVVSFFPWDGFPRWLRITLAAGYSMSTAVLLPIAQTTIAPGLAFVASMVAGKRLDRRTAITVAALGGVTAAIAVWIVGRLHPTPNTWSWWAALSVAAPAYAGISQRERAEALHNAKRAAAEAERAGRSEAREAALVERSRIAREIHDVLGHSLSGIAMQLDMADALQGKGRTGEANRAIRRARALAVDSITETRHAVHALREDTLPLEKTLELMAASESAAFEVTGEPGPVPTETAHAVIRAAQEALTNAAKYAPGSDRSITLGFTGGTVSLTVVNGSGGPPAGTGGGMGLVGMRERVALLGGSLRAGPAGDGWRVDVEVPR